MCYPKPGPRCSSHAGKTRDKALAELVALRDQNASSDKIAKAEENLLAKQKEYEATPAGIDELRKRLEGETDEAKQAMLTRRIDAGQELRAEALAAYGKKHSDAEELAFCEQELKSRTESEEFAALLEKRDELRDTLLTLEDKIAAAEESDDFEAVRAAKFEYRDAFTELVVANHEVEIYKDETAQIAARINELDNGFEFEYKGDTLGHAVKTATFDSGTQEWLEQRQGGIGGSDVGSILKVDKTYGTSNYNEVFASKTEALTPEQIAEQALTNSEMTGPTGRGNAWEPLIAKRFAEENPDLTLIHSKSSWQSTKDERQFINVDGLLASDGENPDGILEIKTASRKEHWDHGVPVGYRCQVMHYLDATGFKYAHVAVMIDDKEYRQYRIEAGEPLDPNNPDDQRTYEDRKPELNAFWEKVEKTRVNGPSVSTRPAKSKYKLTKANEKSMISHLAAYRQESYEAAAENFKRAKAAYGDDHEAMVSLYKSHDPSKNTKDMVYVDLETSAGSSKTGSIIEIGIVRKNPKGEVVESYSALYGIDERILDIKGTGLQEVHNISPDMIRGKPRFEDPTNQAKVRELFKDAVLVAHNTPFEKGWLNQNLDGFHQMNVPMIDTMHISRYLVPDTDNNKLESFAEHHGVPYRNAHRALIDSQMTAEALEAFQKAFHK